MKTPAIFAVICVCLVTVARAQIALVDTDPTPWVGSSTTQLTFNQGITVSSGANVLVVDIASLSNTSWNNFTFSAGTAALTQKSEPTK